MSHDGALMISFTVSRVSEGLSDDISDDVGEYFLELFYGPACRPASESQLHCIT